MISKKRFGIIGGDLRQCYLAQSLYKDGNDVLAFGLEKAASNITGYKSVNDLAELAYLCDFIVLPLPVTRDGQTVNAPLSSQKILLSDKLFELLKYKTVFSGIISSIPHNVKKLCTSLHDYYREDFMILNAVPTAEGAVKIATNECKKTIDGAKCLVTGYGKVGKVLADLLKKMGAQVTISARKSSDLAWAKTKGLQCTNISQWNRHQDFDVIFNTIPAIIFDFKTLSYCPPKALIIDLASEPGGIDKKAASSLKIKSIQALGIPGKLFPETAGKIIKQTLYKIIEEENL